MNTEIFIQELLRQIQELKALTERQALQIQHQAAEIAELKRQLGQNSRNSSKPPSSDGFKKPNRDISLREKGKLKSGGQKGHPGQTLVQVKDPTHVIRHELNICPECATDLNSVPCQSIESRQVFDIPVPKIEVTEHQVEVKCCPRCHLRIKSLFPESVSAPVQYGMNIQAQAAYFQNQQLIPEDRVQEVFKTIYGMHIATATIVSFSQKLFENLATFSSTVLEKVKRAWVKHLDETSCRIRSKTQWLHVASTEKFTHYHMSLKRKSLLSGLTGTVVHDYWRPYFQMETVQHALCNAHHLRELNARIEDKEVWARHMKRLLLFGLKLRQHYGEEKIPSEKIYRFVRLYQRVIEQGLQFHEGLASLKPQAGRGKTARRPGHNFLLRLENHWVVLQFLLDPKVPFTNNLAEQDLRMMKCRQKISGGFRTFEGAERFARIRGLISTARKQGWDVMEAIRQSLLGNSPILE